MMLRNLLALVAIIFGSWINCVFAAEQGYLAVIQRQSAQIKELKTRLDRLEQTVSTMQTKTVNSEVKQKPEKPAALEQEANLPQTQDKKIFFKENGVDEIQSEYDTALSYLKDGKFDEAEQKFANFIQTQQNHKLRENAIFWYAESFYRRNNFNQSAINYLKGYKEYPKGAKAADALLKLSLSLGNLNKSKEACSILDKLESEFPNRPANSLKRSAEAKTKFGCKKK